MRIVFDARMLRWTGVGSYTRMFLEHLHGPDDYVALLRDEDAAGWNRPGIRAAVADVEPFSAAELTRLGAMIARLEPDLVHFPHFNVPVSYRGRYVVTVHDLTPLFFNNARGGAVAKARYTLKQVGMRALFGRATRGATAIITSTEHTRGELVRHLGIRPERISVIPLAAGIHADPGAVALVEPPYLLHVGNFFANKNVPRLIEAFGRLHRPGLRLVLAGPDDWFADRLREHAGPDVIFTGYVPELELVALYRDAELLVMPSLSEGFGLGGIEAMSVGTPVVSSNASCLPEVYGDAAAYFDPSDVDDMASVIERVLADDAERARLRARGSARARLYTWEQTVERTLDVYRTALAR